MADETTQPQPKAPSKPGRFNPDIVYPVGRYSFRRTPGSFNAWQILSHRPDPRTKLLPEATEVIGTESSGKLARAAAEKLEAEAAAGEKQNG